MKLHSTHSSCVGMEDRKFIQSLQLQVYVASPSCDQIQRNGMSDRIEQLSPFVVIDCFLSVDCSCSFGHTHAM